MPTKGFQRHGQIGHEPAHARVGAESENDIAPTRLSRLPAWPRCTPFGRRSKRPAAFDHVMSAVLCSN
jgi:hypothetical protein